MVNDELNRRHEPRASNDAGDDAEKVQRSGATILFWILVAILISLGICVLVSLVLALMYGA